MTADTLKSASITNLDTVPVTPNTAGEGGVGETRNVSDYFTPTTGGLVSTSSTYKVLRVPTNAKIKNLQLRNDAALDSGSPSLAWDVGLYYSDSTMDGTSVANQGASISVNLFAAALTGAYGAGVYDILESFGVANQNKPLWSAAGLSSDPGGYFDIVVAVHTAANTAASHNVGVTCNYVVGQ
jgi:hypothetical protein